MPFMLGAAFLVTCLSAEIVCRSAKVTLNVFLKGCPFIGATDTLNLTLDTKALASWNLLSLALTNSSVSVSTLLHDANNIMAVKVGRKNLFMVLNVSDMPTLADFGLLPFGQCGLFDCDLCVSGSSGGINLRCPI